MTTPFGHTRLPARVFPVLSVVLVLLVTLVVQAPAADAADPRLEKAQARKAQIEERLSDLGTAIDATRGEIEDAEAELERLRSLEEEQRESASVADRMRALRARESYKRGNGDPVLSLLTAEDPLEVVEQARLMAWMSAESEEDFEHASASALRTAAIAEHTEEVTARLEARQKDLAEQQDEAEKLFEEAVAAEEEVRELIAEERAAARAAAARRAAASRSGGDGGSGGGAAAPVSGGVACPVGTPRTYVDSWGAARSGGRRHMGTDILAPYRTPAYAYESGTISRLSSNSLGGISLYLKGDSGNLYYYTHLAGYANVGVGQRVGAGQLIAFVGATGNARGINHLHFEVRPGGGGNVNPYPFVNRAC